MLLSFRVCSEMVSVARGPNYAQIAGCGTDYAGSWRYGPRCRKNSLTALKRSGAAEQKRSHL